MSPKRHVRLLLCIGGIACGLGAAPGAHGHPHSWIDVRTTLVLSAPGQIAAIRQQWLFDEYYTADITRDKGTGAAALQAFAVTAAVNLAPYRFFTHLAGAAGPASYGRPVRPSASLHMKRLLLEFELPLEKAVGARGGGVTLAVYDPTYYIEMLHGSAAAIAFAGPGAASCRARIVPAAPSPDLRQRALEMDRQAVPDHGLGEKFADRVEIGCD